MPDRTAVNLNFGDEGTVRWFYQYLHAKGDRVTLEDLKKGYRDRFNCWTEVSDGFFTDSDGKITGLKFK